MNEHAPPVQDVERLLLVVLDREGRALFVQQRLSSTNEYAPFVDSPTALYR